MLIDLEAQETKSVAEAPPVPDLTPPPQGQAMQSAAVLAARRPSRLARWFFGLGSGLMGAIVSVAGLGFCHWPRDAQSGAGLGGDGAACRFSFLVLALIVLRELAALSRFGKG